MRVWSRVIGKSFDGSAVAEAFEAGPIVVGNKATEEGVAIGLACKEAVPDALLWLPAESFCDAAVEAFDEAVGLRPEGPGQTMFDLVVCADGIERVPARRLVMGLGLHIDGKAIGELAAVVGQDGVNRIGEVGKKAP